MKLKIRREDVLMSLDGVLFLEGRTGQRVAKAVKQRKRNAVQLLKNVAPDLTARQVTIDSRGRVRIDHPRLGKLGRLLAENETPSGSDIGKVVARRVVRPADNDGRGELDFLCKADSAGNVDLVCGAWDDDDEGCNVNFRCGWS